MSAHGFFANGTAMGETRAGFRGGGGGVEVFAGQRIAVGADVSALKDIYYPAVGTFGHFGTQVG